MMLLCSVHQKERGHGSLICTSFYDFNKMNFTVFECSRQLSMCKQEDLELQQEGNISLQHNLTIVCPEASPHT